MSCKKHFPRTASFTLRYVHFASGFPRADSSWMSRVMIILIEEGNWDDNPCSCTALRASPKLVSGTRQLGYLKMNMIQDSVRIMRKTLAVGERWKNKIWK